MPFISDNWNVLTQRVCLYEINAYEEEVLPLYLKKANSNPILDSLFNDSPQFKDVVP